MLDAVRRKCDQYRLPLTDPSPDRLGAGDFKVTREINCAHFPLDRIAN